MYDQELGYTIDYNHVLQGLQSIGLAQHLLSFRLPRQQWKRFYKTKRKVIWRFYSKYNLRIVVFYFFYSHWVSGNNVPTNSRGAQAPGNEFSASAHAKDSLDPPAIWRDRNNFLFKSLAVSWSNCVRDAMHSHCPRQLNKLFFFGGISDKIFYWCRNRHIAQVYIKYTRNYT